MLRFAAYLPGPVIGFGPSGRGRVGDLDEEPACRLVELADLILEPVNGSQQLDVHVELGLVPSAVADPDRASPGPAVQMGQLAFGEVVLPTKAAHEPHEATLSSIRAAEASSVSRTGDASHARDHPSAKSRVSPTFMGITATAEESMMLSCRLLHNVSRSGPPCDTITASPPVRSNGTTSPYSGRCRYSMWTVALPSRHSTCRTSRWGKRTRGRADARQDRRATRRSAAPDRSPW